VEQCKIKQISVDKYFNAKDAKTMLEGQQEISKHIATCQEESCILSLNSRVAVGLQTIDGEYLKDESYLQEELDSIANEEEDSKEDEE